MFDVVPCVLREAAFPALSQSFKLQWVGEGFNLFRVWCTLFCTYLYTDSTFTIAHAISNRNVYISNSEELTIAIILVL